MRSMTGVVLGAVLALSLSACGSGGDAKAAAEAPTKDYCNAARALVHRPGPKGIVDKVQAVGNVSPGEAALAWHDIAGAITTYADVALRSLRDPAHPPVGLTPADTRALNVRLLQTAYNTNVRPIAASVQVAKRDVADKCGFKIDL